MRVQSAASRQRETVKQVKLVDADVSVNRQNEIRDMIARRSYELFERRGASMAMTSMIGSTLN
jgi:hypothetical protein